MYHFRMFRLASVAISLPLLAAAPAHGQCIPAWQPGIGTPGTNGAVNALTVMPGAAAGGNDVIVGGGFTTAGGVTVGRISRYNSTTGIWSALGTGTDGTVAAQAVLLDGDVIVGGLFTTAGGIPASRIARVNPTTGVWSALGSGTSGTTPDVYALAVLQGGDVIVGGAFTTAGGVAASRIARFNPTTGVWSALGSGINTGSVGELAILPGGDVIVAGVFTNAGGVAANNIARYNPTTGVWTALGSGTNGTVYALTVLTSGDVIIGGAFNTAGGIAASRIARYNPNTGAWSAFGSGIGGSVYELAVLPGGDVIVGGIFTTAGGVAANRIARLNPTTGVWSALGSGTNGNVYALAVLPGGSGDVIVGGFFTTVGGVVANRIARYYPYTADAPSIFSQPLPLVVEPSSNAVFYCGATGGVGSGAPTYQWRKGGVAINTITNPSAATPGLALNNLQAADQGSYDCLVTNSCGGTGTLSNAATLSFAVDPCPADYNDDGVVDFFDYLDFVDAFSVGC